MQESNPRPSDYKSAALPAELIRRTNLYFSIFMQKFQHPSITANGQRRASVTLKDLKTLWFNTGTRCNLSCPNCYIESTPWNDRLQFLQLSDIIPFLDEIKEHHLPTHTIGFTGGEPFVNHSIIFLLKEVLQRGYTALILTNGYRAIHRYKSSLLKLQEMYNDKLRIRVSLDHWTKQGHEQQRGQQTFDLTLLTIKWLFDNHFRLSIAGRHTLSQQEHRTINPQQEYVKLLSLYRIHLEEDKIIVFPEMDKDRDIPEITEQCWQILGVHPEDQMCYSERMILKRKGEEATKVVPCTLLAYDPQFELGTTLTHSSSKVFLNHPFCTQFCVLGGSSCSSIS